MRERNVLFNDALNRLGLVLFDVVTVNAVINKICTYVRMYVCTYVRMYVLCTYVCMYVCINRFQAERRRKCFLFCLFGVFFCVSFVGFLLKNSYRLPSEYNTDTASEDILTLIFLLAMRIKKNVDESELYSDINDAEMVASCEVEGKLHRSKKTLSPNFQRITTPKSDQEVQILLSKRYLHYYLLYLHSIWDGP